VTHPVQTGDLNLERLDQAWPLVREIAGGVSLDSWRAFGRAMLSPIDVASSHRGILVAERKRTIRGLVTYETIDDLNRGRTLFLRNAVVMDLALREPIADALHRGSMETARRTQCGSLYLEVVPQMAWIGELWRGRAGEAADALPIHVIGVPQPVAETSDELIVSVIRS
jgi:hypothetical protein